MQEQNESLTANPTHIQPTRMHILLTVNKPLLAKHPQDPANILQQEHKTTTILPNIILHNRQIPSDTIIWLQLTITVYSLD